MNRVTGVAHFSDLQWPADALGRRALLVFEPYEPNVLMLPDHPVSAEGVIASCVERGFGLLSPDAWSFPHLSEYQIVLDKEFDDFAIIDDYVEELFVYPVNALPRDWFAHLRRERSCLVITGIELGLTTRGLDGVRDACRSGRAVGGMLLVNDGSVIEPVQTG